MTPLDASRRTLRSEVSWRSLVFVVICFGWQPSSPVSLAWCHDHQAAEQIHSTCVIQVAPAAQATTNWFAARIGPTVGTGRNLDTVNRLEDADGRVRRSLGSDSVASRWTRGNAAAQLVVAGGRQCRDEVWPSARKSLWRSCVQRRGADLRPEVINGGRGSKAHAGG